MGSRTVNIEHVKFMYWNVCLMMVTSNRIMQQIYIVEYIVVFWLKDILIIFSNLQDLFA